MKIEKTYRDLIRLDRIAGTYVAKQKGQENKLVSAINQLGKQMRVLFEEYEDEKEIIRIKNCATEPTTHVTLKNADGTRQFTTEGELKLFAELKEISKKTVIVHSRIPDGIDELIKTLSAEEKDAFSGLIIPVQPDLDTEYKDKDDSN